MNEPDPYKHESSLTPLNFDNKSPSTGQRPRKNSGASSIGDTTNGQQRSPSDGNINRNFYNYNSSMNQIVHETPRHRDHRNNLPYNRDPKMVRGHDGREVVLETRREQGGVPDVKSGNFGNNYGNYGNYGNYANNQRNQRPVGIGKAGLANRRKVHSFSARAVTYWQNGFFHDFRSCR